jgi:endonuclease/exonuclease/phosphatase family metal-dependent hydrolase
LKVLTFNLRFQNEADGPNNWRFRREIAAGVINKSVPHLLGTQEGFRSQPEDLATLLPNHRLCDDHRFWDPDRMYPCIFYKFSEIAIEQSGDFWLSETPHIHGSFSWGSSRPRLATYALCQVLETGQRFFFCDTHLDNLCAEARKRQALVLLEQLKIINSQRLPLIAVGDFNGPPSSPEHAILTGRQTLDGKKGNLKDAWEVLGRPEEGAETYHAFDGIGKSRIDWILVSPEIQVKEVFILHNNFEGRYPSDHFPVGAHLIL